MYKNNTIVLAIIVSFFCFLSPAMATKPLPPFDVDLSILEAEPVINDIVNVELTIKVHTKIEEAVANFKVEGDLEITGQSEFALGTLEPGEIYSRNTTVKIKGTGKSKIRGWVYSVDDKGSILVGRVTYLYVLSSNEGVFVVS